MKECDNSKIHISSNFLFSILKETSEILRQVFLPRFKPVTLHLRMEVLSTVTRLLTIALVPHMVHVINEIMSTPSPRNRLKNEFGMTGSCSILGAAQLLP